MIDFSLSKEDLEIIEKYKSFTQEHIIPNAAEYDRTTEFPWPIVKEAYKAGIMNGPIPKKFGGNGYNIFQGALASEELGAGCIGIGISIDANTLALTPLLVAANDEQQKRFFGQINEEHAVVAYCLTEPNAGSDVAGIKSTAIKKGDKYILNGHKRFITNGEVAKFHTVFALTDPSRGARSLSAFVVPVATPTTVTVASEPNVSAVAVPVPSKTLPVDVVALSSVMLSPESAFAVGAVSVMRISRLSGVDFTPLSSVTSKAILSITSAPV